MVDSDSKAAPKRLYLIPVLSKALDILELVQNESEPLVLEEIYRRTRISKTTVYRILKTLVHRGYLAQTDDRTYRSLARPKKIRFGFGGESDEMPFSVAVTTSLREAAAAVGIDLLVLDNRYDVDAAIVNAETFVRERVDIVIEFQVQERAAPVIADKIASAHIPMIAVDIPHPHSTYFGIDNYRAGVDAGILLGETALKEWAGKVDRVIGLDLVAAGHLVQSRITGSFEGVKSKLPALPAKAFVRMDGSGQREESHKLVTKFLNRHPNEKRILISAANDMSALGAIAAAYDLGRARHLAVVGHDCIDEMLAELRRPGTPAVASISHEVSQYGPRIVELGLALLRGDNVAPYNYILHRAVLAAPEPSRRKKRKPASSRR